MPWPSVKREVVVDHATREAEVTFTVDDRARSPAWGRCASRAPKRSTPTYLQRRVPFKQGELYDPGQGRHAARQAHLARRVQRGAHQAGDGARRQRRAADRRRAHRPAAALDRLRPQLRDASRLRGERLLGASQPVRRGREPASSRPRSTISARALAIADTGFAFRADFRKPDWWLPGQDGRATAEVLREVLPAYYRNAIGFGVGLDRIISPVWQVRVGLDRRGLAGARASAPASGRTIELLGVPMSVLLNKANSDVDPTRGYRLAARRHALCRFRPQQRFLHHHPADRPQLFRSRRARPQRAGAARLVRHRAGRNVAGIPFDKLFYAGGGGSVRGFVYQSAGPRDAFNNPLGGASVVEGSVEFRQRFGKSFGAVAFVDAGSAYPDILPDFSLFAPRVGAGVGVRYYTDFGPVRLDVGFPLNAPRRRSAVRHLCQPGAGLLMRALRIAAMVAGRRGRCLAGRCCSSSCRRRPASARWRASSSDKTLQVSGLSGFFPTDLQVAQVELLDEQGVWLRVENARLRWSFASLFSGRVRVEMLSAALVDVLRAPLPTKAKPATAAAARSACRSASICRRCRSTTLHLAAAARPASIRAGRCRAAACCRPICTRAACGSPAIAATARRASSSADTRFDLGRAPSMARSRSRKGRAA